MANSCIVLAALVLLFIIIGSFYTLFSLIIQRISASKKETNVSTKRGKPKYKKQASPYPNQGVISTQNTRTTFTGFLGFLLIILFIPALYFNILEEEEVISTSPTIETPSSPTILLRPDPPLLKEGKSWNIVISPEERVESINPEKHSSKKQRSYSYHTQKSFVIELDSFSRKEQANIAAKSFSHPTKVISIGNEFKVLIGDFNTLIEADEYLQKSKLKGFIYQIRTHNAIGRKV